MTLNTHVDAPDYELHVQNGLDELTRTRSAINKFLYGTSNDYVREELLYSLTQAELSFRKALA